MLTLFTIPKPFCGEIDLIQRNAIKSWICLIPKPEIILFGNEQGIQNVAEEMGVSHVPEIKCNEFGTPLLSSVFGKADRISRNNLLCYINADIILMNDFLSAVGKIQRKRRFLMIGKRWNIAINELLKFEERNLEEKLRARVIREGQLHPSDGVDYFVYPKGVWGMIPPFVIGRLFWDNWLIYQARHRGAAVIDATSVAMAIHQNHSYTGRKTKEQIREGPEGQRNLELAEGVEKLFTLLDATHIFKNSRVRPIISKKYIKRRLDVFPVLYPKIYPKISKLVNLARRIIN